MKLYPIKAGNFKLDGGAMFGVVPKSIWQKTNPADQNNLIDMAARCLLIEDGNRLILIDSGMGDKQSDKFFGYYSPWGNDSLISSLKKHGFEPKDITDVFHTHLHFDHCGGTIKWNSSRSGFEPVFKNAKLWSNKDHWQWATEPNKRERASFLKENLHPMLETGQLHFVPSPSDQKNADTGLGFEAFFADGHTEKQMIPLLNYKGRTIAFMADLLPTVGHLPIPYVMGYDTRPLLTLDEKELFLKIAADHNYLLFLEHDAHNELISVQHTDKGVRLHETYKCQDFF
jgi:glyoxylase-like metal-dependent hydrolase (beta-lactamase superfamily II)